MHNRYQYSGQILKVLTACSGGVIRDLPFKAPVYIAL